MFKTFLDKPQFVMFFLNATGPLKYWEIGPLVGLKRWVHYMVLIGLPVPLSVGQSPKSGAR